MGRDERRRHPLPRRRVHLVPTPGVWGVYEGGLTRYSTGADAKAGQGAWWHFPLEGATTGRKLARAVLAGRRMVCVARGAGQGLVAFNGRNWLPDFIPPDRADPPSADWVVASNGAIFAGARAFGVARFADGKWERQNIDEAEFSGVLRDRVRRGRRRGRRAGGVRGGVCRFKGQAWSCVNKGFAAVPVVSLSVGPKGELWAALKGGGLKRHESGQWSDYGLTDGLPTLDALAVSVASDGTVLAIVSPAAGRTAIYRLAPSAARFEKQEVGGEPTTLARDAQGRIFVGTTGGSLLRFSEGSFVPEQSFGALRGSPIVKLAFDAASKPWVIQERETGARRWNGKSWAHFTRESGLLSNKARDVAIDARGAAWIATDEGLTEYLAKDP